MKNLTVIDQHVMANTSRNDLIASAWDEANCVMIEAGLMSNYINFEIIERSNAGLIFEDSTRMSKTLGKVIFPRRMSGKDYIIRFQRDLIDEKYYTDFLSVMIHEMIHILYPFENHGPKFKEACNKINAIRPELNITTTYHLEEHEYQAKIRKEEKKYTIKCPKCGAEWKYARMNDHVRHPEWYLCKHCQQTLVRVK